MQEIADAALTQRDLARKQVLVDLFEAQVLVVPTVADVGDEIQTAFTQRKSQRALFPGPNRLFIGATFRVATPTHRYREGNAALEGEQSALVLVSDRHALSTFGTIGKGGFQKTILIGDGDRARAGHCVSPTKKNEEELQRLIIPASPQGSFADVEKKVRTSQLSTCGSA